jgi:DNA modification methylase
MDISKYEYYRTENGVLYHGDCLEILPHLEPESVTLLITDPPYGHKNHNGDLNSGLNKLRGIEDKPIQNDSADKMRMVVDGMLKEAIRVLKKDCCCCCCCCGGGPKPTFSWVAKRLDSCGLEFFHSVIWDKKNPGLGWRFRRQHEMLMFSHRVGGRLSWNEDIKAIPNIIQAYPPRVRLHPNEKPLPLWRQIIEATSNAGDIVLDPFFGSGTTAVTCDELGRKWIGIELEEKYCEISAKRIEAENRQLKIPGC